MRERQTSKYLADLMIILKYSLSINRGDKKDGTFFNVHPSLSCVLGIVLKQVRPNSWHRRNHTCLMHFSASCNDLDSRYCQVNTTILYIIPKIYMQTKAILFGVLSQPPTYLGLSTCFQLNPIPNLKCLDRPYLAEKKI